MITPDFTKPSAETMEIGIVLLPNDELLNAAENFRKSIKIMAADKGIYFNTESNILHISFYQLNVDQVHLEKLKIIMNEIAASYGQIEFSMDTALMLHSVNLFWPSAEARNNMAMRTILQEILKKVSPLRHNHPMQRVQDFSIDKLTAEQKSLINEYGIYWGLRHNFNPHFTMLYNISDNEKAKEIMNACILLTSEIAATNKFIGNKLAICSLGYYGNVLEVLKTFDLKR